MKSLDKARKDVLNNLIHVLKQNSDMNEMFKSFVRRKRLLTEVPRTIEIGLIQAKQDKFVMGKITKTSSDSMLRNRNLNNQMQTQHPQSKKLSFKNTSSYSPSHHDRCSPY